MEKGRISVTSEEYKISANLREAAAAALTRDRRRRQGPDRSGGDTERLKGRGRRRDQAEHDRVK